MQSRAKISLIEACRIGTFLTCYTQSAALNIDEQLFKRAKFMSNTVHPMVDILFKDYVFTPGIIHAHFDKCKNLCNSFFNEHPNEDLKPIKEFAFSLRNILFYSEYRELIKELEKNNSPLKELEAYTAHIEQKFTYTPSENHYGYYKYLLLYLFVRKVRETSRYLSRIEQAKPDLKGAAQDYSAFAKMDLKMNELLIPLADTKRDVEEEKAAFEKKSLEPFVQQHGVTIANFYNYICLKYFFKKPQPLKAIQEDALAPYFINGKMNAVTLHDYLDENIQANAMLLQSYANINVYELMLTTDINTTELHDFICYYYMSLPPEELQDALLKTLQVDAAHATFMEKMLFESIIQWALVIYVANSTHWFSKQVKKLPIKSEPKKNPKAIQIKATPETQLKKEIYTYQQQLQVQSEELKNAQLQLAKMEKQLAEEKAKNFSLQQANEEYEELLTIADQQPAIPEGAQKLVVDMKGLLTKLEQELNVVVTKDNEQEETFIDKVAHLKIAVIGGHQKYHSQLKAKFKQSIFTISPEKLNFHTAQLTNYDVVVITTDYMNHSLYDRTFDRMKKSNMKHKALILDTQPNAERLAKEIWTFMN